jgi:hypothetical protein
MAFAGVENGNECYCGSEIKKGAVKADAKECNMACSSNKTEMCGGNWRLGAFKVQCSGTPVPAPPTPPPTPAPPPTPETPFMVNSCRTDTYKSLPFCNTTLPIMDRVEDAIGRMTLQEKISNLGR